MSCGSAISPTYGSPIDLAALRPAFRIRWLLEIAARLHARQRQRRALRELDARLLRDIGLTRQEALREGSKPFWR
jgi:uncharacterized protein YjiS (DUF1127 family)